MAASLRQQDKSNIKDMKQFLTLFAAFLIAALPLSAANVADDPYLANNETKEFNLNGFNGLSVSWVYQVELSQSGRHSVKVEAPDFVMPYLDVAVSGGVLKLGLKDVPRDLRRRIESGNLRVVATVTMPELTSLRMSGASKLNAQGDFSSRKDFDFELSGATNVQGLVIRAADARIEASGAAKFSLNGNFDTMKTRLSGSVNGSLTTNAKEARFELSGAAKLSNKGTFGPTDVRASGAAVLDLDGAANELDIEGSGAAKINTSDAPSRTAKVRLSGAANANIHVNEELSVSLSGACHLRYRAGDRLRILSQNVSRASSLSAY